MFSKVGSPFYYLLHITAKCVTILFFDANNFLHSQIKTSKIPTGKKVFKVSIKNTKVMLTNFEIEAAAQRCSVKKCSYKSPKSQC